MDKTVKQRWWCWRQVVLSSDSNTSILQMFTSFDLNYILDWSHLLAQMVTKHNRLSPTQHIDIHMVSGVYVAQIQGDAGMLILTEI